MVPLDHLAAALAGHYRVDREVGRGGMATVYLAEDLKHGRQVALKVLHAELAAALGSERFLSEIRTTATLQHPNILPLFDSGEADGVVFYVMPYVEGETLRARLERDQQLPVDEAVRLAQLVAGALDYAHRHGVIHRDIKPENILLSEGQPLVADFGLALAVAQAAGTRLTQSGITVGTPAYMSPEQAAGERGVDRRTDVYSLGAVLYEMLAGQAPYTGPTAAVITARKMTESVPPLRAVRDTVPAALEAVVRKALARTPADRFATAQQFAEALELARTFTAVSEVAATGARTTSTVRARWRLALAGLAIASVAAALGATLTLRRRSPGPQGPPVTRLSMRSLPGDSIVLRAQGTRSMDISPDGRLIVYSGVHAADTSTRLFVRNLETGATTALGGTEGAYAPFFNPDGEWIGYFEDGTRRLLKVPSKGGQPQPLCDCGPSEGADWGSDGWIYFDPSMTRQVTNLRRVRETGGKAEMLPVSDTTFSGTVWAVMGPRLLPGGKAAIVTAAGAGASRVSAISLETGKRTDLVDGAWGGQYVDPGFLVYGKTKELWAVRFDPDRLVVLSDPVLLVDNLQSAMDWWAEYAVSRSGTLVYSESVGVTGKDGMRLVWIDRNDQIEPVEGVPGGCWMGPRLSPDGQRITFWGWPYETCGTSSGGRVWIYDRARGAPRPLTDDAYTSAWPIFAPDGNSVISNSSREPRLGFAALYRTPVDGSGTPERLTTPVGTVTGLTMHQPSSWSPDGTLLAFQQGFDPKTLYDFHVVSVTGDRRVRTLLATRANERMPMFSPDGRWLAYVTDESGRSEVYVRPYPAFDAPVQVTREGGDGPVWSASGREIFFTRGAGIFAVPFDGGRTGEARRLVNGLQRGSRNALALGVPFGRAYDVASDGRILATQLEARVPGATGYQVVLGWSTELRARFAGGK